MRVCIEQTSTHATVNVTSKPFTEIRYSNHSAGRHDEAHVLVAVEHVVIVVRPRAAGAVFRGAFEGEHVVNASSTHAVGVHVA